MSIEDQIAAAWKRQIDTDGIDWASDSECFARGYIAALRSLFAEVKPENLNPDIPYLFVVNGEWRQRQVSIVELLRFWADESEKVYMLNLPSPSDLFTKGVPR